jgi:hypothetical protein
MYVMPFGTDRDKQLAGAPMLRLESPVINAYMATHDNLMTLTSDMLATELRKTIGTTLYGQGAGKCILDVHVSRDAMMAGFTTQAIDGLFAKNEFPGLAAVQLNFDSEPTKG